MGRVRGNLGWFRVWTCLFAANPPRLTTLFLSLWNLNIKSDLKKKMYQIILIKSSTILICLVIDAVLPLAIIFFIFKKMNKGNNNESSTWRALDFDDRRIVKRVWWLWNYWDGSLLPPTSLLLRDAFRSMFSNGLSSRYSLKTKTSGCTSRLPESES